MKASDFKLEPCEIHMMLHEDESTSTKIVGRPLDLAYCIFNNMHQREEIAKVVLLAAEIYLEHKKDQEKTTEIFH